MTAATLTDRYIWAVQRSLPERQREDIDRELRGTIADTIDGKIEGGTKPAVAEREVIAELGDPYRLAAGFADRPLHLIGPALFPDYVRLLKVLYAIVLPIAAAAILLGLLLSQPESAAAVSGPFFGAITTTAVHLGFWPTVVFALIERSPERKWKSEWTPDSLPELPPAGAVKLSDAIGPAVFLLSMLSVVLWQQFFPFVQSEDGTQLPLLEPGLWTLWLPVLFGIAVLKVVFAVVVFKVGRWTVPLAIVNAVMAAAVAVILVWLFATDQIIDPRWAAELELTELVAPGGTLATIGAFTSAGIAVWDIMDGAIKTWRQRKV